jgi:hypothetical protein
MQFVPINPPSLHRWLRRGMAVGFATGLIAIAVGYILSWHAGNMEPLEGVFWHMILLTMPTSLVVMKVAESTPEIVGPWAAFFLAFVVLPVVQGGLVACVLWSLDAIVRRRWSLT